MHRRHQHLNIPIEIVRTVVAISETGSLSKAGEKLGLSQPAVSSQINRLQSLVGGALFSKTANGTTTTELGKLALREARRILEANDQLLRLAGKPPRSTPVADRNEHAIPAEIHQAAKPGIVDRCLHPRRSFDRNRKGIDRRLHRHR